MKIRKIDSPANERIRGLVKESENYFVFEGKKIVDDLIDRGVKCMIIITGKEPEGEMDYEKLNCDEFWVVSKRVMSRISSLKSTPGMVAIVAPFVMPVTLSGEKPVIGLYNIQDPGNMGTLFRCASAFGIEELLVCGDCASLKNRKFLRAAQDSLFNLRVEKIQKIELAIKRLEKKGFTIYLTSPREKRQTVSLHEMKSPAAVFIGGEGSGFDNNLLNTKLSVHIHQTGNVDSLNAGISGCIIMHELEKMFKLI